jgi:MFS superfamily sulfate permease-like transporter
VLELFERFGLSHWPTAILGAAMLVRLVAGGAMLLVVIFVTEPLAFVPNTALASVILVSAVGPFDLSDLRLLYRTSGREFMMSVSPDWREAVQAPRQQETGTVPLPPDLGPAGN